MTRHLLFSSALGIAALALAGCGAVAPDEAESLGQQQDALTGPASVYNIVTRMSHGAGAAVGSDIWSLTRSGAGPRMTYGPYATTVPAGENFAWTKVQASPAAGSSINLHWDGWDRNRFVQYFNRYYYTTAFKTYYLGAMVNMPSDTNLEFRVDTEGNGNLQQGNLMILTAANDRDQEFWGASHDYHQVGYAVPWQSTWRAAVGAAGCDPSCGSKYLSYGPYVYLNKGPGSYVAAFSLSLDRNTPSTEKVATIDILYRTSGGTTYSAGGRDIYRGDFEPDDAPSYFPLEFTAPNVFTYGWEFRVKWHAVGTITQQRTTIYKVQ